MRWLRRLVEKIYGPQRSFMEQAAFDKGFESDEEDDNPYTAFADRRAWREGREAAGQWKDRAWRR